MIIECPYCGSEIRRSSDIDCYDWDGTTAVDEFNCPECSSYIELTVEAEITSHEITGSGVSQKYLDALYEQEQEAQLDYEREEGLL